ncbi:uncharacterized protein METZ01_LOCUS251811 [marine metagenome]|uniref:Uncharacterized protein n=1 Tax=marine metagenome TaxID=408172 RepID=A0A382II87_9ZZZZ
MGQWKDSQAMRHVPSKVRALLGRFAVLTLHKDKLRRPFKQT